MKKLSLGLSLILSAVSFNSYAHLSNDSGCGVPVLVPQTCASYTLGVTGLYWRSFHDNDRYAATIVRDGNFTTHHPHSLDQDYDWGVKAYIGYSFPCSGKDLYLTYTHFDQDHHKGVFGPAAGIDPASVSAPLLSAETSLLNLSLLGLTLNVAPVIGLAINTPLINVSSGLTSTTVFTDPGTVTFASACHDNKLDTWDLDIGQNVNFCRDGSVRLYGGLRYASIEQTFNTDYRGTVAGTSDVTGAIDLTLLGLIGATITLETPLVVDTTGTFRERIHHKNDFDGVGPRVGATFNYALGCGFGVVADVSTSILVGDIDTWKRDTLDATLTNIATTAPTLSLATVITAASITPIGVPTTSTFSQSSGYKHCEKHAIPNVDLKLGLNYRFKLNRCNASQFAVEVGYQASHYWDVFNNVVPNHATLDPTLQTEHQLSTTYAGPYINLEVKV